MELPECSTVPVVTDCLKLTENVTNDEMPEVIKWNEESPLNFEKDQAVFVVKADSVLVEELTRCAEEMM